MDDCVVGGDAAVACRTLFDDPAGALLEENTSELDDVFRITYVVVHDGDLRPRGDPLENCGCLVVGESRHDVCKLLLEKVVEV